MTLLQNPMARLVVLLSLALLLLSGCGQNEITGPDSAQVVVADDPLEDVLKSLDGETSDESVDPVGRLPRLAEILGLDETQLVALTEAYTAFRDGVTDLRAQVENGNLTQAEACEAAAVLREAFEAELQLILTAEQWDLLQEMRQNAQGPHGHHLGHQNPYDRWHDWLAEIAADEEQVADVFEALGILRAGIRDLRDQVHAGELTREEARDAVEVLRADFEATLQTILTPEQYEELQALRPDCGDGGTDPQS